MTHPYTSAASSEDDPTVASVWSWILARRAGGSAVPPPTESPAALALLELFQPLLARDKMVFAHLAQSLDGRIAMLHGDSFWITGPEDIRHTHRLRAITDAVVVGAETALRDDPRLTVREVRGTSPLRVVLDPLGRVPATARLFTGEGESLLIHAHGHRPPPGIPAIALPGPSFSPESVIAALATRGVHRIFIEGGGVTVSRFLAAGCLDRLHLVTAPVLLGRGRPSLDVDLATRLSDCPRPPTRQFRLGDDWLFDCAL